MSEDILTEIEIKEPTHIFDERRAEKRYSLKMFVGCNTIESSDAKFLSYQKPAFQPEVFTNMPNVVQEVNDYTNRKLLDDPNLSGLSGHEELLFGEHKILKLCQSLFNMMMASNRQILANQLGMKYQNVSISVGGISFSVAGSSLSGIWGNNFNAGDLVKVSLMGSSHNQPPLCVDVVGKILRIDLRNDEEDATEANLAIQFAYGSPEKKALINALINSYLK